MTAYTAVCARAGKWWEITVPELEAGAVTQVRSLDEVESTVRDLVVLMTDASPDDVTVNMQVPGGSQDRGRDPGRVLLGGALLAAAAAAVGAFRRVLQDR